MARACVSVLRPGPDGDVAPPGRWSAMPTLRNRTVLVAATVTLAAILGAVMGLGTPSLRTSDDAEMMAAVSGYDGGARRPELLFTNVLVGRVLVALYDLVPAAPWYGIYLHGLQFAALVAIAASLSVLLRGSPVPVVATVGVGLLLTAANAMMAVQFTIVGILLAVAGGLVFLALRAAGRGAVISGAVGGLLLGVAFLVRVQSFGLGLVLFGLLVLVTAVVRREADVAGWAALALVTGALVVVATLTEQRWWAEEVGAPRPLPIWSSGLQAPPAASGREGGGGRLSANDRVLMANWLIWPDEMFAYTPEGLTAPADTAAVRAPGRAGAAGGSEAPGLVRTWAGPLLRSGGRLLGESWWALLPAVAVAGAATDRRGRAAACLVVAAGAGLLAVVGVTRLPDRVAIPMLFGLLAATAVAAGRAGPRRPRAAHEVARSRRPGLPAVLPLVLALVAVPTQLAAVTALSEEATWRRDRAESFLGELAALPGDPVVILWLIDSWHALHPLGWEQQAEYPVDAVQLAGWQFVLPYRVQQRADLGVTDWITAVADRDDVLLVAEEERVVLLQTLLRERRGRLCTEVDAIGSVRDGRELLVRGIDEVPCQGVTVIP